MREALDQGGTSFDALYVNVNGSSGYFDRSLDAYRQEGRPCRRCRTPILLGDQGPDTQERVTYWCPSCQAARSPIDPLARTGEPHVRTTTAQRELETTFVVDLTPSMGLGTRRQLKKDLALTVVAAFSHLASGPGDRVGAVLLSRDGIRRLPSRATASAAPYLLSVLDRVPVAEGTAPSLGEARRLIAFWTDLFAQ